MVPWEERSEVVLETLHDGAKPSFQAKARAVSIPESVSPGTRMCLKENSFAVGKSAWLGISPFERNGDMCSNPRNLVAKQTTGIYRRLIRLVSKKLCVMLFCFAHVREVPPDICDLVRTKIGLLVATHICSAVCRRHSVAPNMVSLQVRLCTFFFQFLCSKNRGKCCEKLPFVRLSHKNSTCKMG